MTDDLTNTSATKPESGATGTRKPGRPPKAQTGMITLSATELRALVETAVNAAKGEAADPDALMKRQAQYDAEAMDKALNPSNKVHPGISSYSYPEGDLARPREGILTKRVFWCGIPCAPDVNTAEELELLEQIRGGEYRLTKSDGSKIRAQARLRHDDVGRLMEVWIEFPVQGDAKHNHRSMVDYLREMVAQQEATTRVA